MILVHFIGHHLSYNDARNLQQLFQVERMQQDPLSAKNRLARVQQNSNNIQNQI